MAHPPFASLQLRRRFSAWLALCLCLCLCASVSALRAAGDFSISLIAGSGLSNNPEALAAFQRAADEWASQITNPVTIYVNIDLSTNDSSGRPFGANTIGSTSYGYYNGLQDLNLPFDTVRNALAARASRPGDELLGYLPTSSTVHAIVPGGTTLDNTTLAILRANQRVLGLLSSSDTRADGTIAFNSAFNFDYNRFDADGVGAGKIDFQTAAAHEIGHLLGFISDVDDFDSSTDVDSDNLTTLDLFRFPSANKPTSLLGFQNGSRVLKPGVASVFSDITNNYEMSTGFRFGDGNQAAHWKDDFLFSDGNFEINPLIGIMDPTLGTGAYEVVGPADLRVMELLGYNLIPEPGSVALLGLGATWVAGLRWRRAGRA